MCNRRAFLKTIAVAGLAAQVPVAYGASPKRPNIVLLFIDDLGRADLHYRLPKSIFPNIDRLSRESMNFTDAYAASPTCSPSRASVVTGQHPARLRLVRHIPDGGGEYHVLPGDPSKMPSRNWLPLEVDTYANALTPLGYRSAFVGKWHLGPEPYFPVHHGFHEQYGVSDQGHPRGYYPPFFKDSCESYKDATPEKYLTDRLTDDAVKFIETQGKKQPFQLSFFYYAAHTPFQGRKDLLVRLADMGLKGLELNQAAMIAAVDESVGRVRKALSESGVAENTMILLLGDQGSLLPNAPFRGGKRGGTALYEGGARIPFMVHWPGVVSPGSSSVPVVTTDVFPTMIEAAGGKVLGYPNLDGESLMPLLKLDGTLSRSEIILYRSYEDQYVSIRRGKWKMIAYRSGKMELFNLKSDLSEERSVSGEHPAKVKELQSILFAWETKMGVAGISGVSAANLAM